MSRSRLLDADGFNQLAKGHKGYYLYNIHDIYVGQAIEKYGEYGGLEAQFLEQICGPRDVVIEVGANIGAHTVGLAKRVGPMGYVLAFEPQRLVFQNLCANIALNSLTNVECHWAAVGATQGFVTVPELDFSQRNNFGGLSLVNVRQGRRVPCVTLDDFLGLPRVRLIKIDVEGMESDVITGGKQVIAKFKPFLYVENDRIDKSENLMRLIDGLGYCMYWHTPALFNPHNYYGEAENIYDNIGSFNMFCVHRDIPMVIKDAQEITDFSFHPLRRS
jgi:FkbM family methyltransferase